jgi:hypothetical protein
MYLILWPGDKQQLHGFHYQGKNKTMYGAISTEKRM